MHLLTERSGLQAFLDAAICFFVPFLAASPLGNRSSIDVFSVGKTIFTCMLGVVTMEIMIVARYWTWWFAAVCALSYLLVYPYMIFFHIFWQNVFGSWDLESSGVGINIMATPFFWIALLTVYSMTFSIRYGPFPLTICQIPSSSYVCSVFSVVQSVGFCLFSHAGSQPKPSRCYTYPEAEWQCRYFERSLKWLFRPDDSMILAELEDRERMRDLTKPPPDSKHNASLYPVVEDPHAVRHPPCEPLA